MLEAFKKWSFALLVVLSIVEAVFFFAWANVVGCLVLVLGWYSISKVILTYDTFVLHPVIFYVSLGLGLFYYFVPLFSTIIALRPLTYGFHHPYLTMIHQAVYLVCYLTAFILYRKAPLRPIRVRRLLEKMGFFEPPTNPQLWVMGILGTLIFLYTRLIMGIGQTEADEVPALIRFLNPIQNFIFAPVLILFHGIYNSENIALTKDGINKRFILVYVAGIMLLALFSNGRQFMVTSIILIGLLYSFDVISKREPIKNVLTPRKILLIGAIGLFMLGPLAKMANAMVYVRGLRTEISPGQLFMETIYAFQDEKLSNKIKDKKQEPSEFEWSEDYSGNVFLDRMGNLRISDMTLHFVHESDTPLSENLEILANFLLAQIPTPFLNFVGIHFNKYDPRMSYSVSSLALLEVTGNIGGGKLVASHTGTGIWLFGLFYPFVFVLVYYLIMFLMDSFVLLKGSLFLYSPLIFFYLYYFFSFLNYKNGIITDITFLTRPFIQLCFIYWLVFQSTKFIASLVSRNLAS